MCNINNIICSISACQQLFIQFGRKTFTKSETPRECQKNAKKVFEAPKTAAVTLGLEIELLTVNRRPA
jgi:hypothetical protein